MPLPSRKLINITISSLAILSMTAGLVSTAISPAHVQAQTAVNTDIFTGQFIPAYYGSAYDPSEAFKQMAGTTVFVFAYDTFDKMVNNFVYKSQIKADGSFQAAGLPNASHYGVCVPIADNNSTSYFRPPIPGPNGDGLESSFAFKSVGLFKTPNNPVDQFGQGQELSDINRKLYESPADPALSDEGQWGCRTFLTSSRTVDIANHVNIFPLVPNSVLSVIINDAAIRNDYYSLNRPYEVYAQRIVINNAPSDDFNRILFDYRNCVQDAVSGNSGSAPLPGQPGPIPGGDDSSLQNQLNACLQRQNDQSSSYNSLAGGPVIRGRTVPYTGPDGKGAGTIFQAYAPRGLYAITYWRPDSKDITTQITYQNYNGTDALNTQYNGMAFENVSYPGRSLTKTKAGFYVFNDWKALASRDPASAKGNAWLSKPSSINLWGVVTASTNDANSANNNGSLQPRVGIGLEIGSPQLKMMDVLTRKCVDSSTTNSFGVYFFTTNCPDSTTKDSSLSTTISIKRAASSSSGSKPQFDEILGIKVSVNGSQGPARKDLSLRGVPANAITSYLKDSSGKPMAYAFVDLISKGQRTLRVAQADSSGFIAIPSYQFKDKNAAYQLAIYPSGASQDYKKQHENRFALNPTQIDTLVSKGGTLGAITVKPYGSPTKEFLANLSLKNLFNKFRVPVAYAESVTSVSMDNVWSFNLDLNSVKGLGELAFNRDRYSLKTVEINPSQDLKEYTEDNADVNLFVRDEATDGIETAATKGQVGDAAKNAFVKSDPIIGVRLVKNSKELTNIPELFAFKGTDRLNFNLKLQFENNGVVAATTASDENGTALEQAPGDTGQEITPPDRLEANSPIEIVKNGDTYTINYSPVALHGETASCGGKLTDVRSWPKAISCGLMNGAIGAIDFTYGLIGDHVLRFDPLGQDTVVKMWNVVRNLVNGMSVLFLIMTGVAIMFRYEPKTFSLQSAITSLLITIVLVNFSILIIQVVVDITNVFSYGMTAFLQGAINLGSDATSFRGAAGSLTALAAAGMGIAVLSGGGIVVGVLCVLLGLAIMLILVGLVIFVQFILRLITVWLCIILAPAAFAARMLPGTKKFYTKWQNTLAGALIAQVALGLTLAVSFVMLQSSVAANSFGGGFLMFGMGLALMYMATKVPNKAQAMFGAGFGAGFSAAAMTQFGRVGKFAKMSIGNEGKARRAKFAAEREYENALREKSGQKAIGYGGRLTRRLRQSTGVDLSQAGRSGKVEIEHAQEEGRKTGFGQATHTYEWEGEDIDNYYEQIKDGVLQKKLEKYATKKGKRVEDLSEGERNMIIAANPKAAMIEARKIKKAAMERREHAFEGGQIFSANKAITDATTGPLNPASDVPIFGRLLESTDVNRDLAGVDEAHLSAILAEHVDDKGNAKSSAPSAVKDYLDVIKFAHQNGGVETIGGLQTLLLSPNNKAEIERIALKMGYTKDAIAREEHLNSFAQVLGKRVALLSGEMDVAARVPGIESKNHYVNQNRRKGRAVENTREGESSGAGIWHLTNAIDADAARRLPTGYTRLYPPRAWNNAGDADDAESYVADLNAMIAKANAGNDLDATELGEFGRLYGELQALGYNTTRA